MVDATCASCGASFQLEDAEVPPSGKVIKCRACGKPITVMHATAAEMGFPAGDSGAIGAADLSAFGKPTRPSPLAGATPPATPRKVPASGLAASRPPTSPGRSSRSPTSPGRSPRSPFGGVSKIPDIPLPIPAKGKNLRPPHAAGREIDLGGDDIALELGEPSAPASGGVTDLPSPVLTRARSSSDSPSDAELPVPLRPSAPYIPIPRVDELPAPVASRAREETEDLPAPVRPSNDLVDLPAPVGPNRELPAPKGFFDDVPGPAGFDLGDSLELARAGLEEGDSGELPAPKGFFDDVPGPLASFDSVPLDTADTPAPKGFFDDVPGPAAALEPSAPREPSSPDIPAPKGFFDDIPSPSSSSSAEPDTGTLELDDLDLAPSAPNAPAPDLLELGSTEPLDLGGEAGSLELDSLELGSASASDSSDTDSSAYDFGNVDLPAPPTAEGVVSFDAPAPAPARGIDLERPTPRRRPAPAACDELELAEAAPTPSTPATLAEAPERKMAPSKGVSRSRKIASLCALVLIVGGAGGYYWWHQRQADARNQQQVRSFIARARTQLAAGAAGHWDAAARLAGRALTKDKSNADALGIAAQAHYAAFLDTGRDETRRTGLGNTLLRRASAANATGLEIDRAEALQGVASGRSADVATAVKLLRGARSKHPNDANTHLYLGWAHLAARSFGHAAKAFEASLEHQPDRIAALYGLGRALAHLGKKKEARAAFAKVIERDANHVGAQLGNVELLDLPLISDREARYVEILSRNDIDKADPRAVARGWSLAADQALLAGRIDEANQRYHKALALHPTSIRAMVGKATAAIRLDRLDLAKKTLTRALDLSPAHFGAAIALVEVELEQGKLAGAAKRLDALKSSTDADMRRAHMLRGRIAEATEDAKKLKEKAYTEAIESYKAARKLGEAIAPSLALARVYRKAKRKREAIEVLAALGARARGDAALALTLGLNYMENNDARVAEEWFERARALKPGDAEATFQLGLAQLAQKKAAKAAKTIAKAYAADPSREEIGVKLARVHEQLGQNDEAEALYKKLLAAPSATVNARARAGRFLVRMKRYDQIAELAGQILKVNKGHPAGLFLEAEAKFQQGKYDDAARGYSEAVKLDPDPQYLDGLGRAYEKLTPPAYDDALAAYTRATRGAPSMLQPRLGIARIYLARNMLSEALGALAQARRVDPKNSWIYFQAGMVYQARSEQRSSNAARHLRSALEQYRLAIKYDRKNAEAHYRLGRVYYDSNRARDAVRSLAHATALAAASSPQPTWLTEAYRLWGYAERSRDNRRGAIKAFERYLARDPQDRDEANEVRRLLIGLKSR